MKTSFLAITVILFLAGISPAFAQISLGIDTGYACWQCPVCGYVVSMTPAQAESVNPYTPCPACYSAYAGSFVPVSCQAVMGDASGQTEQLDNQPKEEIGNELNLPEKVSDGETIISTNASIERSILASAFSNHSSIRDSKSNLDVSTKNEKILMVLAPEQYQEEELNVPRDYFQSMGYSVVLTAKGVKTANGMDGESAQVDLDLSEVKLSDYVAVVFVGGEGIYNLKLYEDLDYQALAKSANGQGMLIGAICLGPWILADAGILSGISATASETDHIKSKGAIVSDEAVIQDGNIITGNGPSASEEFARAMVEALKAKSTKKQD